MPTWRALLHHALSLIDLDAAPSSRGLQSQQISLLNLQEIIG